MLKISISKSSNQNIVFEPALIDNLRALDQEIQISEFERPSSINMWEWFIPASVVLNFAKPFFNAFMNKLGDAAGEVVVNAVKEQFSKTKINVEKLHNRKDIEELQKRSKAFEGDSEKAWQEFTLDIGKQISPLELRISEVSWIAPDGHEFVINYRFVFTANMTGVDVVRALEILADDRNRLLQQLPIDFLPQLNDGKLLKHQAPIGKVEAVFDKKKQEWVSFPSTVTRLKDKSTGLE